MGVIVEVTHRVPSPGSGFDATQCAGKAGAVTPSQFSTQGPVPAVAVAVAVGAGVPPAVAVAVAVGAGVPPGPLRRS